MNKFVITRSYVFCTLFFLASISWTLPASAQYHGEPGSLLYYSEQLLETMAQGVSLTAHSTASSSFTEGETCSDGGPQTLHECVIYTATHVGERPELIWTIPICDSYDNDVAKVCCYTVGFAPHAVGAAAIFCGDKIREGIAAVISFIFGD